MSITKRERERLARQESVLLSLGFTQHEADNLRRISLTLRRWHELECGIDGGAIERDAETDRPYFISSTGDRQPVADRERGAIKRLGQIVGDRNTRVCAACDALAVHPYVQTDPRGAALYILRPGDVPEGCNPDSCYTRGICVY